MDHLEAIAHLLRRTTFGPVPGQVESLADRDVAEIADKILDDTDDRAASVDDYEPTDEDYGELERWWLDRLRDPAAGLHERMVWYWHGHFTTSLGVVEPTMMWKQHQLVRRHALGNFRELTRSMLTDAAMLVYLSGDGSSGDNPNENLGRELMELFTLGVGNYTEDDVKAAARALSGYWVDWETSEVHYEAEEHYSRPISFLGLRGRFGVDEIVDAVCDHPSCARHVAARLHRHLVGVDAEPLQLDHLASVFRDADLEIHPLVAAIVRSDAFWASTRSRPRQPIEWLIAALAALGSSKSEIEPWTLEVTGQTPFYPPNVAGWPNDDRWVDGSQVLNRINQILELSWQEAIDTDIVPDVDAVLARCSIWNVSAKTREVLNSAERDQSEYDQRLELLFALTLASPEFALA